MHFAFGDAGIVLSGQLAIPGFDAGKILTAALWRGWVNAADASNLVNWPQGLGFTGDAGERDGPQVPWAAEEYESEER